MSGDGKKESDAGADSKSSKETESIIQAELESYADEPLPATEGKGEDYCHRSPCKPWDKLG